VRAAQSFIEGRILTQARATEIFVGERLADARARLKELQNQFVDLQGSKGVVQLSSQSSLTLNQAAKLRARIMDKEIQLDLYKDVLRDSGELVRLKAEKDQLQAQLDSLMGGGAQRNGSRVKEKVMDVFTPLNLVPSMEKDFAAATLDHTTQAKLVELLQEQFELAKIDSKKNQPGFEVIDPPLVPMFPSGPNVKLYVVVGTLFGAFFSVVSVLTLNLFGLSKLPRHVGRLIVVEQSKPLTSDRLKASAHR
jgi:capsule polysaccharide export protein KpsE/RkpR